MARRSVQTPRTPKLRALAGVALTASLFAATPALAITEYLGGGFVTVSDSCAEFGWSGTHQVLMRIEPQGMAGNASDETQISLMMNTGTIAMRVNLNRGVRHVYDLTQAIYIWNGPFVPEEPTMKITFNRDADWPPSARWQMERVAAIIDNFNEHEGCVARLHASLVRN